MATNLTAKAGGISAINKGNYQLSQYLFNLDKSVYIRGTPEGYDMMRRFNKRETADSSIFKNTYVYNPGRNLYNRYVQLYKWSIVQQGQQQEQITPLLQWIESDKWIEKWQGAWAQATSEALDKVFNTGGSSYTGQTVLANINSILTEIMNAPAQSLTAKYQAIQDEITKLENLYNAQPPKIQAGIIAGEVPSQLADGTVLNYGKARPLFTTLRNAVGKLRLDVGSATTPEEKIDAINVARSALSRNIGKINEVLDGFVYGIATQTLEEVVNKAKLPNIEVVSLGDKSIVNTGSASTTGANAHTGKPDNTFFATVTTNGENSFTINLQAAISEKITSQLIVNADGKWSLRNPVSDRGITLATITQLEPVINDAFLYGQSNPRLENIIYNSLQWETGSTSVGIVIRQAIIAQLFEKFLAGGAQQLAVSGNKAIDLADALMVNGVGIPVYEILQQAAQRYERQQYFRNASVKIAKVDNSWVGTTKNLTDAQTRSNKTLGLLKSASVEVKIAAKRLAQLMNSA